MTQDLVSTAPGIFIALLGLVQTAGAAQNPAVSVFAFELGQYQPATYVTIHAIENHHWEWAYIDTFTQYEEYDVVGCASVYSGDSPFTTPSVASTVMTQTYNLFQACVMTPVMSNRTIPVLGGPANVIEMTPNDSGYTAGLGDVGGSQTGWAGEIPFSFHFRANVTPQ